MKWESEIRAAGEEGFPTLMDLLAKDVERLRGEGRNERYIELGVKVNYRALMAYFKPDVRAVTDDSLDEYVKHRRKQGVRRQTISKELTCLKRGFRLARVKGPEFWPKLSKDARDDKLASKLHNVETWRAWLKALKGEAYDIALFALCTGLRRGELYRVSPKDIRTIDGHCVLQVHEKIKRANQRRIVLGPLAQTVVPRLPFQEDHRGAHANAAKHSPSGNITLRDCRAAFRSAAGSTKDVDACNLAMGHSGIPALYIKNDYDRLAQVSLAVERWLVGIVDGIPTLNDKVRNPLST